VATLAAGLSTAVGDVIAALAVVARAGDAPAITCGRTVGTAATWARATPPVARATVPAASGDEAGAGLAALAATVAACRETLVVLGPGCEFIVGCGPALAATSAARVGTLATAAVALRDGDGVVGPAGPTVGSIDGVLVARRGASVLAGCGASAANCVGAGSPALGEACGAVVVWRRVAVLAAASSVEAADVAVPVGAGWTLVAAAMLGAPVLRVSVVTGASLGTADGAWRPSICVSFAAAIADWLVVGSAAGSARCGILADSRLAVRSIWLACGVTWADADTSGRDAVGAVTAAVAATSGRVVIRG
jgi:hypothetical protein